MFLLTIPLRFEQLAGLQRLVMAQDYNIGVELMIKNSPDVENQIIIDSLKEVLVQALIACDWNLNGERN